MNDFETILENCVDQIASGEYSLEECLSRHPKYAAELEPILSTTVRLQRVREVMPPPFLRARIRAELTHTMGTNPRQKRGLPVFFWRMALNVAVLLFALVMTNTVFAQGALPGETLYDWKLASENMWRLVTVDPVGTDLQLSNRRVNEYLAVSNDETRRARVLAGYNELLVRFKAEDNQADRDRILLALKSQHDSLRKVGLSIPELDSYFSGGATETGGEFQIATPQAPVIRPLP
jgi:hypothetical protein